MEPFLDELRVYATLNVAGLMTENEFQRKLDGLFLRCPEDPLLLELECEGDPWTARKVLWAELDRTALDLDPDRFGRCLMDALRPIYQSGITLEEFSVSVMLLRGLLPEYLAVEEPFWSLSCAEDVLDQDGDRDSARAMLEEALNWYETH